MTNFNDFCKWAVTQKRASEMLGVSEATVSRWANAGRVTTVAAAKRVEEASHGLYRWHDMLVAQDEQDAAA